MKYIRTTISILLISMIVGFSLTAKGQAEKSSQSTHVDFWHSNSGLLGDAMNHLVREFNDTIGKENNIVVEAVYQGMAADVATKLRASLQSGRASTLPDLAQLDATGVMDVRDSSFMVSVEKLIDQDPSYSLAELQPGTVLSMTYKGEMIGMPFNASTILLYYNKDAFREAGLDPNKPPKTLDDLASYAQKLVKYSADGKKVEQYGYMGVPTSYELVSWIGQQNHLSYLTDFNNGHDGNPTHVLFDSEGTLANFLNKWRAVYNSGGLSNSTSDVRQQFIVQKTAMFSTSTSSLSTILDSVDGRFEVGVGYFPMVDEHATGGVNIGGGALFVFDNNNDPGKKATWEFLKYLMSPEVQLYWHQQTGYFPVANRTYELEEFTQHIEKNPLFKVAIDQLHDSNPEVQSVWWPNGYQVYYEIQNSIIEMLEKNKPTSEVVTYLSETINRFMDEYNRMNK